MSQGQILVVDDDREMRISLQHLLERAGFGIDTAKDGREALRKLEARGADAILCDVRMPGMDGLDFLRAAVDMSAVPVILFSAHGDIPMAVEAIQKGAYSFLEKPFEPRRLLSILSNAVRLKRLQDNAERLEARLTQLTDLEQILIGNSPQIQAVRQLIFDYAPASANVLIIGETGTGKELVARALHDLGPGPGAPFVAVNCAAIPVERFEETVFGSAGALGLMQQADGGTLFLDELTSMPLETQSKFLRALDTKSCQPVGQTISVAVDMQIVSAASMAPDLAISQGTLRQDLVFRLNTLVIDLPTLAERGDDILLLFRHYLRRFAALYDVPPPEIEADGMAALLSHGWPGNVRELQGVAERRVLAAKRGGGSVRNALMVNPPDRAMPTTLREAVAVFERELIGQALVAQNGRMEDAAAHLGIGRRTLNEKIVKLGIDKTGLIGEG